MEILNPTEEERLTPGLFACQHCGKLFTTKKEFISHFSNDHPLEIREIIATEMIIKEKEKRGELWRYHRKPQRSLLR